MRYLTIGLLMLTACQDVSPEERAAFARAWMLSHPQQPIVAQPMPQIQPLPPTMTNCYRIGNSINCTSY